MREELSIISAFTGSLDVNWGENIYYISIYCTLCHFLYVKNKHNSMKSITIFSNQLYEKNLGRLLRQSKSQNGRLWNLYFIYTHLYFIFSSPYLPLYRQGFASTLQSEGHHSHAYFPNLPDQENNRTTG